MKPTVFFVTSNEDKFNDVTKMLGDKIDVYMIDLSKDIQEIQGEYKEVALAKLDNVRKKIINDEQLLVNIHKINTFFMIDDVALEFECMSTVSKSIPGVYIKHFLEAMGCEGLAVLASKLDNNNAAAYCSVALGWFDRYNHFRHEFFLGLDHGTIVYPRTNKGSGWESIFKPDDSELTYAEMDDDIKCKSSYRASAMKRVKDFLFDFNPFQLEINKLRAKQ